MFKSLRSASRRATVSAWFGVMISAGLVSAPLQAAEVANLRFSSFEPPMAKLTSTVLTPFTKEVSAASEGTLDITMFAGGALGRNPTQQLKLVLDGVADLAWVVLPYTPGRFDDADVVGLPFAIENAREGSLALQRMYERGELRGFDDLKVLAVAATPPVTIHATTPIQTPTDMSGKRARVSGSILTQTAELLNATPVQVGGGQIAEALSRGVVDLTLNNWGFVGDFKVDQVTSHHLNVPLGAVAVGVVMRQDKYDALPAPAKAALDEFSGEALSARIAAAFDEQQVEVMEKAARSRRNTVVDPDSATLAEWQTAVAPVTENWRTASPENQALYQSFVAEVDEVREP